MGRTKDVFFRLVDVLYRFVDILCLVSCVWIWGLVGLGLRYG